MSNVLNACMKLLFRLLCCVLFICVDYKSIKFFSNVLHWIKKMLRDRKVFLECFFKCFTFWSSIQAIQHLTSYQKTTYLRESQCFLYFIWQNNVLNIHVQKTHEYFFGKGINSQLQNNVLNNYSMFRKHMNIVVFSSKCTNSQQQYNEF